jgi:hypothetical protein
VPVSGPGRRHPGGIHRRTRCRDRSAAIRWRKRTQIDVGGELRFPSLFI